MKANGVTVRRRKADIRVRWKLEGKGDGLGAPFFSARLAGVALGVHQSDAGRFHASASLVSRFDHPERKTGKWRRSLAKAKADAISLGREIAEEAVWASMEIAEAWGVEYPE